MVSDDVDVSTLAVREGSELVPEERLTIADIDSVHAKTLDFDTVVRLNTYDVTVGGR